MEQRHCKLVVALSLCTTVHPFYTKFAKILGASISETTIRPNPRYKLVVVGRERSLSVRLDHYMLEAVVEKQPEKRGTEVAVAERCD